MRPVAQPLLDHNQTEQKFVIVLMTGLMTFEESSHGLRVKQTKHKRAFVQECLRKPVLE